MTGADWDAARDRATWENQAWAAGAAAERERILGLFGWGDGKIYDKVAALTTEPDPVMGAVLEVVVNAIRADAATQAPQGGDGG